MMLTVADVLLILATSAVCTGIVTLASWSLVRLNRRGSVGSQIAIMVCAAILGVAGSTWALAAQMLFSSHELVVLVWVMSASTAMSLVGVWFTARSARAWLGDIQESVRLIGQGEVVDAHGGWKEFAEVSSELAATSERLAHARDELQELDLARRQFFSWISHDLRTPLAGVRVLAEALEAGVAADPGTYLRQLRSQVDTMTRLVDDLFELSQLQSGRLTLRCESVDLIDIISEAVLDVADLARSRKIHIRHVGTAGHALWADAHELTRVVVNLLANAIRYAPVDSEIVVSATRSGTEHLILTVLDQGPGVATEDLGRMFEVGWRANTARTAATDVPSGAGLGLAIVRGIVEAHGGEVAAGHVSDGFQLSVRLPLAAAS